MTSSEQKVALRQEMKQVLLNISDRDLRSQSMLKTFVDHQILLNVQFVSIFISFPEEINTRFIAEYCWSKHKVVCVPEFKREQHDGTVVFREWVRDAELIETHPGLFHPKYGPLHRLEEMDLILVPGIAFTQEGKRLGRGKGFYDKLLSQYSGPSIGLCFKEQIKTDLPWEEHDKLAGKVLTC